LPVAAKVNPAARGRPARPGHLPAPWSAAQL